MVKKNVAFLMVQIVNADMMRLMDKICICSRHFGTQQVPHHNHAILMGRKFLRYNTFNLRVE